MKNLFFKLFIICIIISSGPYLLFGQNEIVVDGSTGNEAVRIEGVSNLGGSILLNDDKGTKMLKLGAVESSSSAGSYLEMFNKSKFQTVMFDGSDQNNSGNLWLGTATGNQGVEIDAFNSNFSAQMTFTDNTQTERMVLAAQYDNGDGNEGTVLKLFNEINANNTIELDGADANDSGAILLSSSGGNKSILIDAQNNNGSGKGLIELYDENGNATLKMDADYMGNSRVTTDELAIMGGSDLSEMFDVNADFDFRPGYIVSLDPNNPGELAISNKANDPLVAGVISGANGIKPGMLMGQAGTIADGDTPVALTGRVYTYCNNSNGEIQPGDLLTTSDQPGYAMKANQDKMNRGTIIGKAISALTDKEGLVLVLINLQ